MAAFITLKSGETFEFHVGIRPDPKLVSKIAELQADGDELERIRAHCTGIPDTNNRCVTWYGDHAKFIYDNTKWARGH